MRCAETGLIVGRASNVFIVFSNAGMPRYVARPPVAQERLSVLPDGRVLYELPHRWRDGTTHVGFLPLEFVEKLAALVHAPRANLVRYHGILAPAARHRSAVVPKADVGDAEVEAAAEPEGAAHLRAPRRRNYTWAELMPYIPRIAG